jgi:hypothetical protein
MSITRRTVLASGFTAFLTIFPIACQRAYPPALPSGVPTSAQWAGGLDGGGWVTCSNDTTGEQNTCTIYDEEGRTRGSSQYKLRNLNRAANENELHYKYVTGQAIGLDGGLELVQVSGKL